MWVGADTDFIKDDVNNGSWNVVSSFLNDSPCFSVADATPQVRSEFDELLLRHAGECGATVLEEHKVIEVHFEGSEVDRQDTRRPYAVTYARPSGETGRIEFDYLVDASGRNGILSTKVSWIR